jgi:hypothetical protein
MSATSTIDLSLALPYLSPAQSTEDTAPLFAYGTKDGPIVRQFSTTLVITYMIEEPGALVFVRERDVERNKRDELHARAVENLRVHTQRRKLRFEATGAMHTAKLDGQHDASLLLLDELWDPPTRIADPEGELVAAVPSRNVLVFTGTNARGGIPELRATVAKASHRGLSPELFVRRNKAWESFD